jgi:hypothetical protein
MTRPKRSRKRRPRRACAECDRFMAALQKERREHTKALASWIEIAAENGSQRDQARKELVEAQEQLDIEQGMHDSIGTLCFEHGASTDDGTSIGAVRGLIALLDSERSAHKITTGALCMAETERDAADKALAEYVRDWAHEQKWHAKVRESFLWLTDRPAKCTCGFAGTLVAVMEHRLKSNMVCKPWWKRSFGDWLRARAGKGEGK